MFTFSDRRIALFGLRCDPALRFMANTTKGFRVARGFGFRFIEFPKVVEEIDGRGARGWSRTIDARLFKPSLYRLSYPCKNWKQRLDSNQRFRAYPPRGGFALRLARTAGLLYSAKVASREGVEPSTFGFGGRCAANCATEIFSGLCGRI